MPSRNPTSTASTPQQNIALTNLNTDENYDDNDTLDGLGSDQEHAETETPLNPEARGPRSRRRQRGCSCSDKETSMSLDPGGPITCRVGICIILAGLGFLFLTVVVIGLVWLLRSTSPSNQPDDGSKQRKLQVRQFSSPIENGQPLDPLSELLLLRIRYLWFNYKGNVKELEESRCRMLLIAQQEDTKRYLKDLKGSMAILFMMFGLLPVYYDAYLPIFLAILRCTVGYRFRDSEAKGSLRHMTARFSLSLLPRLSTSCIFLAFGVYCAYSKAIPALCSLCITSGPLIFALVAFIQFTSFDEMSL